MFVNVVFPTMEDNVAEAEEQFNVILRSPQNALIGEDNSATVLIRDDDSKWTCMCAYSSVCVVVYMCMHIA